MDLTLSIPYKPTILVIGDVMLDHTFHGNVTKLANEAPIPVYKQSRELWSLGGAGNVAANLARMGCNELYLFGRVNCDMSELTSMLLTKCNIQNELYIDPIHPTIIKHRYYSGKTLLFRHDNETIAPLPDTVCMSILERIRYLCVTKHIDSIILSDYSKGFLTPTLCQGIVELAKRHGIFTCVDPKDDYSKYKGCSLLKPNRVETARLFGITVDGTNTKDAHIHIHNVVGCDVSVITLSEDGASIYDGTTVYHCANQPMEVIDVTGAGDSMCATFGYLYPLLRNPEQILQIANKFAMISVGHIGSYVLTIRDFIHARTHTSKLVDVHRLQSIVSSAHDAGCTSIFTNGCFDILHVGHIDLLKRCKAMGDIVIIGLNSDTSIQRLKGPDRPIMNIEKRIAFLSALEYVDFICVFEEDTPAALLERIRPSILVKGGDYTIDKIIGREFVNSVCIVPFVDGFSTTSVIQTITAKNLKSS
jgi:D-beta-D-heptose 7-phosphate kinase / D-beta-D-heptose 1-phosphate adenosyltransferase